MTQPPSEPGRDEPSKGFKNLPLGVNRAGQMGVSGLQLSIIGSVLVGCILVGWFGGNWMDGKFGTQFIGPLGVMVGAVAGFREMFRTLQEANRFDKHRRQEDAEARRNARPVRPQAAPVEAETFEAEPAKQRLFSIPAPPMASFEGGTRPDAPQVGRVPDKDEVLESLLEGASFEDEDESDETPEAR